MREHNYRTLYGGLTHAEYEDEPARIVDRQLAIAEIDARAEANQINQSSKEARPNPNAGGGR